MPDEENQDSTEGCSDEPGTLIEAIPTELLSQVGRHKGTRDPEDGREDKARRIIRTGEQITGDDAGDEADQDDPEHVHGVSPLFLFKEDAAAPSDCGLHRFGKLVQEPREGHLETHIVVTYLDDAGRDLAQGARTRKSMRSSDQTSLSTLRTGKFCEALPSAGLMRRKASSLPSLCGMVMTTG
jgi:hypothetical protein